MIGSQTYFEDRDGRFSDGSQARKRGIQDVFKALGLGNQKDDAAILEKETLPRSEFGIRISVLKINLSVIFEFCLQP